MFLAEITAYAWAHCRFHSSPTSRSAQLEHTWAAHLDVVPGALRFIPLAQERGSCRHPYPVKNTLRKPEPCRRWGIPLPSHVPQSALGFVTLVEPHMLRQNPALSILLFYKGTHGLFCTCCCEKKKDNKTEQDLLK